MDRCQRISRSEPHAGWGAFFQPRTPEIPSTGAGVGFSERWIDVSDIF